MKGVSAIIAVILILMIVVALSALAWTWFSDIFGDLTNRAGKSIMKQQQQIQKNFGLEVAVCQITGNVSFSIRNIGSGELQANQTSAYVNNFPANIINNPSGTLVRGDTQQYITENVTCSSGQLLKVTIESGLSKSIVL